MLDNEGGVTPMAVPARRTSKAKKAKRRTHYKLTVPGLTECANCGEMKKSHHVCSECGYYDGKDVMKANEEA